MTQPAEINTLEWGIMSEEKLMEQHVLLLDRRDQLGWLYASTQSPVVQGMITACDNLLSELTELIQAKQK